MRFDEKSPDPVSLFHLVKKKRMKTKWLRGGNLPTLALIGLG